MPTIPDPKTITITVDTLTHGPHGLGRYDGKVVLVPGTAPGDVVEVRIRDDRKHYAIGELVSVRESGPSRTRPPCPYAGTCGGCSWQHVDHETQLSSKEKNVADALARTARLRGFEMLPILRSSRPYHYRRRIRLHIGTGPGIGFHRLLSHDVVPLESCLIAEPPINAHIPLARRFVGSLSTHLTSIEILDSHDGQVIFVARGDRDYHRADAGTCRGFRSTQGGLAGIVLSGRNWRRHWGEDQIPYSLGNGLHLRIDADAFSQVNRRGNQLLLEEFLRWADLRQHDRILELYSGAGNLTLPMARKAGHVVAVEAHRALVRNGRQNAHRNGLDNIEWRCEKVRPAVLQVAESGRSFPTIVMNPPRSGARDAIRPVARLGAQRIFYVACDAATMARDVGQLCELGYRLERLRPMDLFPQTHHVEVLVELRRDTGPRRDPS